MDRQSKDILGIVAVFAVAILSVFVLIAVAKWNRNQPQQEVVKSLPPPMLPKIKAEELRDTNRPNETVGVTKVEDVPSDLKKLEGMWVPIKQEEGGKEVPKSDWGQTMWHFKDGKAIVSTKRPDGKPNADQKWDLEIDPDSKPAKMDLKGPENRAGFMAIYKFDGDNLIVCWNVGRETRPSKFATSREDFYWLITFKRAK